MEEEEKGWREKGKLEVWFLLAKGEKKRKEGRKEQDPFWSKSENPGQNILPFGLMYNLGCTLFSCTNLCLSSFRARSECLRM